MKRNTKAIKNPSNAYEWLLIRGGRVYSDVLFDKSGAYVNMFFHRCVQTGRIDIAKIYMPDEFAKKLRNKLDEKQTNNKID